MAFVGFHTGLRMIEFAVALYMLIIDMAIVSRLIGIFPLLSSVLILFYAYIHHGKPSFAKTSRVILHVSVT